MPQLRASESRGAGPGSKNPIEPLSALLVRGVYRDHIRFLLKGVLGLGCRKEVLLKAQMRRY